MKVDTESMQESLTNCSAPYKTVYFVLNFIIWLLSCVILALGIYAIVDSPYIRPMVGDNSLTTGAVVLILVGVVGFIISFIGCCGALNNNKCLILTHVTVLCIMLAVLLIGLILGVMFKDKAETVATNAMIKVMKNYNASDPKAFETVAWDDVQNTLKCCGILNYTDWETYAPRKFQNQQRVPLSCCKDATLTNQENFGCFRTTDITLLHNVGCLARTSQILNQHAPGIATVGVLIALAMIMSIILGIVVYRKMD